MFTGRTRPETIATSGGYTCSVVLRQGGPSPGGGGLVTDQETGLMENQGQLFRVEGEHIVLSSFVVMEDRDSHPARQFRG